MDVWVGMMATDSLDKLIQEGLHNLKHEEYQEALQIFDASEASNNPLWFYGKATTLFKMKNSDGNLDLESMEEIVELYDASLSADPRLADSYLMLGLAYTKKAGLEAMQYKQNHSPERYSAILGSLHNAEINLSRAAELNSRFAALVSTDLEYVKRKKRAMQEKLQ